LVLAGQEVSISHPRRQSSDDEVSILAGMKAFDLTVAVSAVEGEQFSSRRVEKRESVATQQL